MKVGDIYKEKLTGELYKIVSIFIGEKYSSHYAQKDRVLIGMVKYICFENIQRPYILKTYMKNNIKKFMKKEAKKNG